MRRARLPGPTVQTATHQRRRRFSIVVVGALVTGCATIPSVAESTGQPASPFTVERNDVDIGTAEHQTVLTGFLRGGAMADLAVVHIDENDERRLQIYAFGDDTWGPRIDATLGPGVLFVDVANIGGRDRLVTYRRGRLHWFDPDSATPRTLLAVTSTFDPPDGARVHHVDITRDVNDDGRDDVVVPDIDGFWVFVQMDDGAFADPVKIGPPTDMSGIFGADGYQYDPWSESRIHQTDFNRDGRDDLVFWNTDHLEVHHQVDRRVFLVPSVRRTHQRERAIGYAGGRPPLEVAASRYTSYTRMVYY